MHKLSSDKPGLFHLWNIIGLLVLLCIMLLACSNPNKVMSLLGNDPSKLPCWRGICPGAKITQKDVIMMLNKTKGVTEINFDPSHNHVHFQWNAKANSELGYASDIAGYVVFSSTEIDSIHIDVNYSITIGEFVSYFGSPDCVYIISQPPDWYSASLDYSFKGLGILLDPITDTTKSQITSDMTIRTIYLRKNYLIGGCATDQWGNGYPWKGFNVVYP
jgi:hypothetical protein